VDALSGAIKRAVALDPSRSKSAARSHGTTSVDCVFISSDRSAPTTVVGSIQLVTYPSVAAATAAVNGSLSSASQLGVPVTRHDTGTTRTYAEPVPNGWSCAAVSAVHGAEATLATKASATACAWAQIGLGALTG
jgi:hypothetical protein